MDGALIIHLGRRLTEVALALAGPVLAVTLVSGLIVSLLQAVTSIRDMSLGVVVRLAAVAVTLLICGGWMLEVASEFVLEVFHHMQGMGH